MTHQVPMISAMTLQNFREVASELLAAGQRLEPTAVDHEQRRPPRALDKHTPFRLPRTASPMRC